MISQQSNSTEYKTLRFFFVLIFCFQIPAITSKNVEFNRHYVGTVFEPYTKFTANKNVYTMEEVEDMLELVGTKFSFISTYGMGTADIPDGALTLNQTEAQGWTAIAASNLNQKNGQLRFVVRLGTWFENLGDKATREIDMAFTVAEEANLRFNGTVDGIIIGGFFVGNDQRNWEALGTIQSYSEQARNASLKLGTRTNQCGDLARRAAADNSSSSAKLFASLDFIQCVVFPENNGNLMEIISHATGEFMQTMQSLQKAGIQTKVIGEPGIPSYTNDRYDASTSVDFWRGMNDFATSNKFRIDMFTAMDEPWKKRFGEKEKHFGWWKRIKSDDKSDSSAFIEKAFCRNEVCSTECLAQKFCGVEKQAGNDKDMKEETGGQGLVIGLSVFGSTLLVVIVAGLGFLYKKMTKLTNPLINENDIREFEKGAKPPPGSEQEGMEYALILPYDRSYEISSKNFSLESAQFIGAGTFGSVYKGKLAGDERYVALKVTQNSSSASSLKSLLSEIKIMIHVGQHPNVVSIIGACTADVRRGMVTIISELCDLGSLESYLRKLKESLLQQSSQPYENIGRNYPDLMKELIRWCLEISQGMEHISSKNVIHADLATRNVLLTSDKTAKITDFGLSRRLYTYTNYVKQKQEPLPWRHMAPESLLNMNFSTKSDVWSYGITIWELYSLAATPYPGLNWNMEFALELENGIRCSQPRLAPNEMYSIMCDCWKLNPIERPTFSDLTKMISSQMYMENVEKNDHYVNT